MGRAGTCSLRQAIDGIDARLFQDQVAMRVVAGSRTVDATNDGFLCWMTPKGIFRAPWDTGLLRLLAGQERRPYDPGVGFGIRPGDVVLDCGANVGTYTRQVLKEGAGLVVAIEPVPDNLVRLQRSFAREIAAVQVIVYPKGLWDKNDVITMWIYPNSALDSFVMAKRGESQTGPRPLDLPLTTVDRLVAEL